MLMASAHPFGRILPMKPLVLSALVLLSVPALARSPVPEPSCPVPRGATFTFTLDKVPLHHAAQVVADIACTQFVLESGLENHAVTVVTPAGKQYRAEEVYQLFVGALELNGIIIAQADGRVLIRRKR
jgi:type II secretory pathway component GspD/PulD (secretin)